MKPLTREWVAKAQGDYATARRELRARKHPNFDAACFHAQQCAEKYLKALLQENGLKIARSHNLEVVAQALLAAFPFSNEIVRDLRALTGFAVETRYPGKSAGRQDAREAVASCSRVRSAVRKALRIARTPSAT